LSTVTTAGQRHDSLAFELVLDKICVKRRGRGRPRRRPDDLLADKAYSSKAIRRYCCTRKIRIAADRHSALRACELCASQLVSRRLSRGTCSRRRRWGQEPAEDGHV
jgi:hypothetical protein